MNDDLIARAEALMPMLDGCHDYANIQAAEMVPELVAEVKRLTQLIDHTASNFLQLQPGIVWEGGIADAMKAAVGEIKRLRIENERAERAHESLDAMRKRQLAAKDAEICILKTEVCAAQKNIKRRDDDINGLMKELARWRQIAIEATASRNWYKSTLDDIGICHLQWGAIPTSGCNIPPLDYWKEYREQAAKELSIHIEQEASYLSRLEEAFQMIYIMYLEGMNRDVAEKHARDALEKIQHAN